MQCKCTDRLMQGRHGYGGFTGGAENHAARMGVAQHVFLQGKVWCSRSCSREGLWYSKLGGVWCSR